jgi:hypothetical protein
LVTRRKLLWSNPAVRARRTLGLKPERGILSIDMIDEIVIPVVSVECPWHALLVRQVKAKNALDSLKFSCYSM